MGNYSAYALPSVFWFKTPESIHGAVGKHPVSHRLESQSPRFRKYGESLRKWLKITTGWRERSSIFIFDIITIKKL